MSKKHYVAIAQAIRHTTALYDGKTNIDPEAMMSDLVSDLVPIFKADNPAFDAPRFRAACCLPIVEGA